MRVMQSPFPALVLLATHPRGRGSAGESVGARNVHVRGARDSPSY